MDNGDFEIKPYNKRWDKIINKKELENFIKKMKRYIGPKELKIKITSKNGLYHANALMFFIIWILITFIISIINVFCKIQNLITIGGFLMMSGFFLLTALISTLDDSDKLIDHI